MGCLKETLLFINEKGYLIQEGSYHHGLESGEWEILFGRW